MRYHGDVAVIQTAGRRGVSVIATAHGRTLLDVFENPVLHPLIGDPDVLTGRRRSSPIFRVAVEIRAKGLFVLHEDVAGAVDALLAGDVPDGTLVTR